MASVFLNGEILDGSAAHLSTEDRGFLLGDGLFESMRAYGGKAFRLAAHLARLRASAEFFRLALPFDDAAMEAAIGELLRRNDCADAYIRLTLARGTGMKGLRLDPPPRPTTLIQARPLTPHPAEQYRSGVKAILSRYRQSSASPLARHKTLNYLLYLLARQEAVDVGANAALLLNEHGQVTEESMSNVFFVKGGRLITPPVHCGLLPGIARAVTLELAAQEGMPVEERPVSGGEAFECDEMFLTNSLMEIMPVRSLDKRALAKAPGAVTARLMEAYSRCAAGECGAG